MMIHIQDFVGKRVHMVGIGGSSMSGLALMLQNLGMQVSGSDQADSYATQKLARAGITVYQGQSASHVQGADLVVHTAAIASENPELQEARRLGIPLMERAVLLGQLAQGYETSIAVSGTHGKTTTTSMIAQILMTTNLDPTIHIGGVLDLIGGNMRVGQGDVFLTEACEFKGSFLTLSPTIAVVLNIDFDHPDFFRDITHTESVFEEFLRKLPPEGLCIGNGDDERVVRLMNRLSCRTMTFGHREHCDLRPESYRMDARGRAVFDLALRGTLLCRVALAVPGDFQAGNAMAALGVAQALSLDMQTAADALAQFTGARRRFELTSEIDGVQVYHDYGHNPTEMRGALSMAKSQPHQRLWAVVQPHTFSRLKLLFDEFIHCCDAADIVLVTDICPAREVDPGDIHSTMLVDAIAQTGKEVHYTPTFDETETYLRAHWQPGDLVITMGCGDINLLNDQIEAHERAKG